LDGDEETKYEIISLRRFSHPQTKPTLVSKQLDWKEICRNK
jgi:hypothetical protein